eukprot:208834_1
MSTNSPTILDPRFSTRTRRCTRSPNRCSSHCDRKLTRSRRSPDVSHVYSKRPQSGGIPTGRSTARRNAIHIRSSRPLSSPGSKFLSKTGEFDLDRPGLKRTSAEGVTSTELRSLLHALEGCTSTRRSSQSSGSREHSKSYRDVSPRHSQVPAFTHSVPRRPTQAPFSARQSLKSSSQRRRSTATPSLVCAFPKTRRFVPRTSRPTTSLGHSTPSASARNPPRPFSCRVAPARRLRRTGERASTARPGTAGEMRRFGRKRATVKKDSLHESRQKSKRDNSNRPNEFGASESSCIGSAKTRKSFSPTPPQRASSHHKESRNTPLSCVAQDRVGNTASPDSVGQTHHLNRLGESSGNSTVKSNANADYQKKESKRRYMDSTEISCSRLSHQGELTDKSKTTSSDKQKPSSSPTSHSPSVLAPYRKAEEAIRSPRKSPDSTGQAASAPCISDKFMLDSEKYTNSLMDSREKRRTFRKSRSNRAAQGRWASSSELVVRRKLKKTSKKTVLPSQLEYLYGIRRPKSFKVQPLGSRWGTIPPSKLEDDIEIDKDSGISGEYSNGESTKIILRDLPSIVSGNE